MSLFDSARFVVSVADLAAIPAPSLPEIAFAGRSNAGKSTVINVLTRRRRLAFASKTPGRTQLLNFFALSEPGPDRVPVYRAILVDLPGYGYAKAPAAQRASWDLLVGGYVRARTALTGIVLVMDARRPFMPGDLALLDFLDRQDLRLHFLINKADQIKTPERRSALADARRRAADLGSRASAQLFSGLRGEGAEELESVLAGWLRERPALA